MAGGILTTSPATEDGTPPVAEESTPPAAGEGTPPAAGEGTPPVAEGVTPSVADDGTPAVAESTLPVTEHGTLPASEGGTPLVAEDGALVPEGDMPPLVAETGTPAVSETDTLPVAEDGIPPVAEDGTPPAEDGIPLVAEEGTPRASAHPGLNFATMARRLRTFVAYVLLLAVLGAAGVCAFALVQGTWVVTPILSGSMRPGFAVGGAVISQRVAIDNLAVRDVIVFSDPNKPSEQIVHRIVRITKNSSGQLLFNTQGDANTVRDPWTITIRGNTVYRARWSVPLLGYVANSYQNHRGDYLLGAGIVLILIAVTTVLETRPGRRRRHARQASPAS
jgi:signal peptidase I